MTTRNLVIICLTALLISGGYFVMRLNVAVLAEECALRMQLLRELRQPPPPKADSPKVEVPRLNEDLKL